MTFFYNICHCQEKNIFSQDEWWQKFNFPEIVGKNAMGNDECEDITLRNE